MKIIKQKLYCYVDENGQDTKGDIFIVSIVVTGKERDELLTLCEKIEEESAKHKDKWGRAKYARRIDYISRVFSNKLFKEKLRYSIYHEQPNYDLATITGIAKAVHFKEPEEYTTLVYVDGLSKNKRQEYGSELRKLGVPTRKVQGVNKDENNALIRLADAVAGFVRDVIDGEKGEIQDLFKKAIKNGSLIEI
ncbi:hypothetical protein A3B42_01785 [Candidatus Daviesbacteria bacterium RIFCSPLOWO2_01_FULL_38_10]|nr:MAG: hypothetical protein US80_C0001G0061 [Candidatus Daviesbacteria bacterium GW2011_GWA2_38_17]OGE27119.1 MAG: hypothetical protein A3D02_04480 [Candidatus Daviesbacteria bacterium RIFCSPHIGHO2_02_FULL_39_41]OGE38433.1 MAG: hypothetical protein A3B42_01785 [Candidatus Daviesbacteria bacterium RIFCSPLOWO2_01_FULL_38_10]OGE45010.1 MAG: hypothetical protein A3E67_02510 [Candidatus Daviesbacteria bacterium RIFCSPHIGHO2_12_FULL_38_25]OGE68482.1 MAG: hypothetical protein A3H81_06020 [Candidatus 